MKKFFFAIFLGVLFFTGHAKAHTPSDYQIALDRWNAKIDYRRNWLDTWVLGVSVGYADRVGSLQESLRYGGAPISFPESVVVRDYSDPSPILGVFGGYQVTCHQWLMGVELNVNWRNVDEDHPFAFADPQGLIGWEGNARYQQEWMAGISGRLGFAIVTYFMVYARLGVEASRDELLTTIIGDPLVYPRSVSFYDKRWVYRFLSGLGAEMPVPCMPFTLRLEYNFRSKGKTIETNGQIIEGVINPLFNSNLQPFMKCFSVGLAWNFF